MASRGRPSASIELSATDRRTLESWGRRHSSAQSLAMRSKIVLGADDGLSNSEIATEVGCHANTASKWRNRFAEQRGKALGVVGERGPKALSRLGRDSRVGQSVFVKIGLGRC